MARDPSAAPKPQAARGWFRRSSEEPGASLRLLCFPPVVAAEARFDGWRRQLPPGIETWTFDPVGQSGKGAAPASLDEIAAAAAAEVAGLAALPLLLFGHREGALFAFETARVLEARHALVPERLILSGCPAPDAEDGRIRFPAASDAALVERLRRAGTPDEVLGHEELLPVILARLRHALALVEAHRAPARPELRCPATLVYGDRDPLAPRGEVLRWSARLGPAAAVAIAGEGDYGVEREKELAAVVAAAAAEARRGGRGPS
jgi:pyochelin biosynthetic protein PchC